MTHPPDEIERDVFRGLTAFRLAAAGRVAELDRVLTKTLPRVRAWLTRQCTEEQATEDSAIMRVVCGWCHYHRAEYTAAVTHFAAATSDELGYIAGYARLGVGKVATDLGHFGTAAGWCGSAASLARQGEHLDLLAAAEGAMGEALLRGGDALQAAEAFSLDFGVLPPGDKYRGRVLCFLAHAYSRLEAWDAAKLAYRIASHQPGEDTAPYAWAGLALGGIRNEDFAAVDEAAAWAGRTSSGQCPDAVAWVQVALAKAALERGFDPTPWCRQALESMPATHLFERAWLSRWCRSIGSKWLPLPEVVDPSPTEQIPPPPEGDALARRVRTEALDNRGFTASTWPTHAEELWEDRCRFMP